MSTQHPDLVDIEFDLDRYIAEGGKLYDIRFVEAPRMGEWKPSVPADVVHSRVERWGRYSSAMLKQSLAKAATGEHLSEDDLQTLWKESAA